MVATGPAIPQGEIVHGIPTQRGGRAFQQERGKPAGDASHEEVKRPIELGWMGGQRCRVVAIRAHHQRAEVDFPVVGSIERNAAPVRDPGRNNPVVNEIGFRTPAKLQVAEAGENLALIIPFIFK